MTAPRFVVVAIMLAIGALACSSKTDHPPVATTGPANGGGGGGGTGGGTDDGGGVDSATDEDAATAEAGPCTATTCAAGCCDSNNTCQPGNTPSSCGILGGLCISCTQSGLTCGANGQCQ